MGHRPRPCHLCCQINDSAPAVQGGGGDLVNNSSGMAKIYPENRGLVLAKRLQHTIKAFALKADGGRILGQIVIARDVIGRDAKVQILDRQLPHRGQHLIDIKVTLRLGLHLGGAGIQHVLLGIQHFQRGARAQLGFLAQTLERNLRGLDLAGIGVDLGCRNIQLRPGGAKVLFQQHGGLVQGGALRLALHLRLTQLRRQTATSIKGLARRHADALAEEVDYSDVDLVVLPGGIPGTPNLAANKTVTDTCAAFAKAGKKVAAICAAPSVLAALGLLEGKNATAHAAFQDKLAGAHVLDTEVVVDGNITTSYGLGGAIPMAIKITWG